MRLPRAAWRASPVLAALAWLASCATAPQREAQFRLDAEHTVAELYGHLAGCRLEDWTYRPLPLLRGARIRWQARCGGQTFICWREQVRHLIADRDMTLCAPEATARAAEAGARP